MRNRDAEKMAAALADALAKLRKSQGLSYVQLAEKAGLHRTTISLIERGKQAPTVVAGKKLADALGVPFHQLVRQAETR